MCSASACMRRGVNNSFFVGTAAQAAYVFTQSEWYDRCREIDGRFDYYILYFLDLYLTKTSKTLEAKILKKYAFSIKVSKHQQSIV